MFEKIIVKRNRYVDSVSLMSISSRASRIKGSKQTEVLMGTPANMEMLEQSGFELKETAGCNDLIIAIHCDTEQIAGQIITMVENVLDNGLGSAEASYSSLDAVPLDEDPYDLIQISLPGEYAAAEAKKALQMGLDVFIFSDNVSLDEELEIKKLGQEKGRLVMGPDCGVGLIKGVALAAGSIIKDGPIGIVGASGSGAQEVGCIIEKCGLGVSSIIGTGGHDLYPQIGGITMLEGIRRLEQDQKTQVIVLVSKLADLGVMDKVLTVADGCGKPVVAVFLGSDEALFRSHKVHGTFSLEEAALKAVELAGGACPSFALTDEQIRMIVEAEVSKLRPEQKYFRGLYCGGTFTEEALLYFSRCNKGIKLHSNLANQYAEKLIDPHMSVGHSILDLGAEDFTAEAPHPVFDPTLRIKRLRQELQDPAVAVVLLDFITGPGVAADPITEFARTCAEEGKKRAGAITFIASICGSQGDPQKVAEKEALLRDAGVIVTKSNYQSTRLASAMMIELEGGSR